MPDRTALLERLQSAVGDAGLLTDPERTAPYLCEWRGHFRSAAAAVVRPAGTDEVAATVAACAATGTAIVPQGGNTGLVGGAVATADQVVLSLDRMVAVRGIDADNDTITVDAGCTLAEVQSAAAGAGRFFPLSLAAEGSCRIGGNLATNAGGVNVLRYGNARDLTLGLEVVLADGSVWNGLRGLRKDNAGFDLKHWFIGSEGTLGIITAAVLKLFPALAQRETAFIAVPDPDAGVRLLGELRRASGDNVIACELVSRLALELSCRHVPGCRDPLDGPSPWYLLVDLASPAEGNWLAEALERVLTAEHRAGNVTDAAVAVNLDQAADFWRVRESVPEAQTREGASIKHDVSVPVSLLPAFVREASDAVQRAIPGVRVCPFGHVGDGNLHFNLCQPEDMAPDAFRQRWTEANRIVHDIVERLGGSFAAEHGIGRVKPGELARYRASEFALMRRIKQALDPNGCLNPGAVIGQD